MDRQAAEEKCHFMSVRELLRATTTDRGDYEPFFHQIAEAELGRRWHQVQEVKKTVRISLNDQDDETVTPQEALARLDQQIRRWDTWVLTNCLGDVLLLQQERHWWVGHHAREGSYVASFHTEDAAEAKNTALRFLELQDAGALFDDAYDITQMIVLRQTTSRDLAEAMVSELEEKEIPVLVQTSAANSLFHSDQSSGRRSGYVLLVTPEHALEAQEAVKAIDTLIERLHQKAELFSQRGETDKEIELYDRILGMTPDDEVALFNKGIALLETERYSDAADCFVEAALLADDETGPRVEECLKELTEKIPNNTEVLNALADLARRRGDLEQARTYLAAILSVQPDNYVAHASLGYLYFNESVDARQALFHFGEYLRLNPDADDREIIEELVRELEAG
jgi:tetratricopeptide (TPR) repeat protein